jgi:hypothetical protein
VRQSYQSEMVLEVGDVRPEQQLEVIFAVEVSRVLTQDRLRHDDESFACNSRRDSSASSIRIGGPHFTLADDRTGGHVKIFCALGRDRPFNRRMRAFGRKAGIVSLDESRSPF